MEVRVRVPSQLRSLVGDTSSVTVEVAAGGDRGSVTITDVLDALATTHPALERRVRDERGATRVHVNVFVGSDNVRDLAGPATAVLPGVDVSIIPAISGG